MRKATVLVLLVSLFSWPAFGQKPAAIADTDCTAANDPHPCCTGSGTGDCDGRSKRSTQFQTHTYTEICAAFWMTARCNDTSVNTDGDPNTAEQWLVDASVCTAAEATAAVPLSLRASDCTASTVPAPWCTGAGTSDGSEHVVTCTGAQITNNRCQNTGTWDFTDSTYQPKPAECWTVAHLWMKEVERQTRNQGRRQWYLKDQGQLDIPESTDAPDG